MGRVGSFRELRVYRGAFGAAQEIFAASRAWPAHEALSLTRQIRRSSRSVCGNVAEAWRKRRYPAAFISKLNDAEAEASETRVWLDFALACGYIGPSVHRKLDAEYDRILGQLVRMIHSADQWAIGAPARRSPHVPQSGTSDEGATAPDPRPRRTRPPRPPEPPSRRPSP